MTLALFWMGSYVGPANAEDGTLDMARGLVCDTAEEVQAFVAMNPNDNAEAALTAINSRFGQNACNIVTTVFRKGEQANTLTIPQGIVRIVKIEVVGVVDGSAVMHLATPKTQYAPIFEEATSV